ncbi:MAG: gamma-glutamylcyclotransferase, partial [Alphaproteobacteria bacterium]
VETRPGTLHGYHRAFCIRSYDYRGTRDRPGLVLGLDRGGCCRGIVFRVAGARAKATMAYLYAREMTERVYRHRQLRVLTSGGPVTAHAFVVDRAHPQYAGRLDLEASARHIAHSAGRRGPNRAYLENTVRHLEEMGIADGPLHRLLVRVEALTRG